uniref:Apolipoprotein L4 n=1 Tax=Zeugodacus cucurbitae TaxID=28588 RepID=A0A0A1WWA4_ZEUCU
MPTRPYKRKAQAKETKTASKDDSSTKDNKSQFTQPSASRNVSTNTLERMLLHNSEELKLREKHCLFPAFNVGRFPVNSADELRLYPSFNVSMPCPIYIASNHYENVDICHRRTMAREIYRKRLHTSRTRYQTVQKDKKFKTNTKEDIYHNSFFELAKRLECDPDPYFHGSYDYYYTGGNLCILGDGEHILHVDGKNMDNLHVGVLPKFTSFTSSFLNPISSQQSGGEVFEVRSIQNLCADSAMSFALRQRNCINFYSIPSTGKMKAITRFNSTSTPFISFAQSPIDLSTFIITTMKQSVRVYDMTSRTPTLTATHDICTRDDAMRISWNMVRPWQGQTFLYANENKFFVIDTRTTPEQWLNSCSCDETNTYDCDFISSIAKSEFRDLAYVATNHKLHCLDLRYLGGNMESGAGAVCRWTHQLEYAPAFMDIYQLGAVEFIALSSALADDMCICELTREHAGQIVEDNGVNVSKSPLKSPSKRSLYKSYCLPYQPPTLQDAYQQARSVGKCLQPDADLPTRISRCSTGLAFYDTSTFAECMGEDDCDTFTLLLSSNSIGDVFAHRLIEQDTAEPEARLRSATEVENTMCEYAKRVCELTQPRLNCTEVVNLEAMRKVFRCNTLSIPLNFEEDNKTKADITPVRKRGLGRWQKPIQTLHSYKDALVQDILSIWDIDYEDDKKAISFSHIKKGLGVKPDPESLVTDWLNENIKEEKPKLIQRESMNSTSKWQSEQLDSSAMTIVHENLSYKIETFNDNEYTLDALNASFISEFMPPQQSTQLTEAILNMPGSPTEQEEFIPVKPKPKEKPVKKKSKYVKGF